VATLTTTNAQLQEQLMSASAALEPLNAKVAELETRVSAANAAQEPLNAKVTELETQVSAASAALDQANENIAILNNHVETAAGSPCEAREASITEQYMTLNDNATMLVETNHNLADKLQIHEQGVAHMAILLDKMISHHAYHKRKSHKSSRSALVIHESMRYELSCMSSHVDDVAFCARISAMPPGKRESGSVYLHKFE
jgi:chromosome segregation ATPase